MLPAIMTESPEPSPDPSSEPLFVPLPKRHQPGVEPEVAAKQFFEQVSTRRSIRAFSDRPVSKETLSWCLRAAGSAPSGANKQPWHFVCISDPALKHKIRLGAEEEEREFYSRRASERWLADLRPLGTDENKEFLDIAPWLVVVFKKLKGAEADQVYYVNESIGLACGMFLTACHLAGLGTLTHTPSPMGFLGEILGRPKTERPFLLIPIGYPTEDCTVPAKALERFDLDQIATFT